MARARIAAISLLSRNAWLALVLAVSVVVTGVVWNTRAAAGADAYGYVSQADLWSNRALFIDQQFTASAPWPLARWTFTPLGYRPDPAGYRIVPSYSPGLPMLMAVASVVAGECAKFWIVPLAGGLMVLATYWIGVRIGRPWVGVTAAWLVATSPTMLFMLVAPMSDVPAAAAWAMAVVFAIDETAPAAAASGLAAAIAILVRPNLVPLTAIVGVWTLFGGRKLSTTGDTEDTEHLSSFSPRPLRPPWGRVQVVRFLIFAATSSIGAIAIAVINARLYGSPLASGYGDLSDAYAWSYVVPNLRRYGEWLLSTETPLAVAGLASLFVPWSIVWPTRDARRVLWLLASVAAGVWASYLIYVPWDAWWYLRFVLPAWPMMTIGAASLIAALCRARSTAWRVAVVAAVIAIGVFNVKRAVRLNVFNLASAEAKYVETATVVESIAPPDAVIICGQFSGSLRYYAGRLTLRWDYLDPTWLDRAVEWLTARGHHVYILLEAPEVDPFRARFAPANALGRVDWVPLVTFRGRSIQLHDTQHRERFDRPIEPRALRAVRECPPPRPPPQLRMP